MISLKTYLEMEHEKAGPRRPEDPADLLAATLSSYRAVLLITQTSSVRACPPIGTELQKRLAELEKNISGTITSTLASIKFRREVALRKSKFR
ncbi:MAG TPA: hypothetical protein VFE02_20415 [Candidatus Acidoferrales bacterium]|jgi:hypothetical protein|nr:hypothetical protein [Candidatus Acidoferrales bacterium]